MLHCNPQQNEFVFKHITFSSKFDSGNLANVKEVNSRSYELYISKDSLPYTRSGSYKVFFHFSVKGFEINETYIFTIRSISDQGRLYNSGFKPVYKVSPNEDQDWEYIPGNISWKTVTDGFQVKFDHRFE